MNVSDNHFIKVRFKSLKNLLPTDNVEILFLILIPVKNRLDVLKSSNPIYLFFRITRQNQGFPFWKQATPHPIKGHTPHQDSMIQSCFFKVLQFCWQMPRQTIFLTNHTLFILGPNSYDFLSHASILFTDSTILSKNSKKDWFGIAYKIEKICKKFPTDLSMFPYFLQTRCLSKFGCKHPNCFICFSFSACKDTVCHIVTFFISDIQTFLEKF
ncbi:Uncharacterised protein [Streptococcus pneumoniae]|nr:Uncharacterised protein [Streptococcus pneumoniae]